MSEFSKFLPFFPLHSVERFLSVESSCASLSECHFGSQSHNEAFRGDGSMVSVGRCGGFLLPFSVRKIIGWETPPGLRKKVEDNRRWWVPLGWVIKWSDIRVLKRKYMSNGGGFHFSPISVESWESMGGFEENCKSIAQKIRSHYLWSRCRTCGQQLFEDSLPKTNRLRLKDRPSKKERIFSQAPWFSWAMVVWKSVSKFMFHRLWRQARGLCNERKKIQNPFTRHKDIRDF